MRKADYILEKFNEFETLISKAQEHGKFVGPELRPQSFKYPGIGHTPTITEPHKMVSEPHKIPSETGKPATNQSKIKIIKNPQGKFVIDRASIPSEWWDEKGKIKPEFQQEWNKARNEISKETRNAIRSSRLDAKRTANINKSLSQLDTIVNVSAKLYNTMHPELNLKNVYSAFKKLVFIGTIAYIWAGHRSKPKSTDQEKQKSIDSVYTEMDSIKGTTISGSELKQKATDLSAKLNLIKAKTPAGQNMIKENISNLTTLIKNLSELEVTPNIDNAGEVQSYANKSNNMLLDGLEISGKLDELSMALEKSNKKDLAILCDEVSNGIKDNVVFVDSAKETASQGII